MVDRVKIESTAMPVTALKDLLEITVKQVNYSLTVCLSKFVIIFLDLVDG